MDSRPPELEERPIPHLRLRGTDDEPRHAIPLTEPGGVSADLEESPHPFLEFDLADTLTQAARDRASGRARAGVAQG